MQHRPRAWYWQVVVRFRVLLLTATPVMVGDDAVTGAGLNLVILVIFIFTLTRVQPLSFLRNNSLVLWSNLSCTMVLFAGVAFAATASTSETGAADSLYASSAARDAITAIFMMFILTTFVVLVHGCLMEWLYYTNESLSERPVARWLVTSCVFRHLFYTDRSFGRDFRRSLTTKGRQSFTSMPYASFFRPMLKLTFKMLMQVACFTALLCVKLH